jgi:hypothetical protein
MKTTETHRFTKGQKLRLDDIYAISGLAGGKWWTAADPFDDGGDRGETVTITEDITITISATRKTSRA